MIPPKPGSGLYNSLKGQGAERPPHPFWEETTAEQASSQDDLRRKRAYRIAPDQLAVLRETAKKFEGSHNFHNFTVGRDFRDRSCQRFLKSIDVRIYQCGYSCGHYMHRYVRFWILLCTAIRSGSQYCCMDRASCCTR